MMMQKQYFWRFLILFSLVQPVYSFAQGLSPTYEVKSADGKILLEKHTIFFGCRDAKLDQYYVIRTSNEDAKNVLDASVYRGRFSGEVKSYFPNGSLRSRLNCSTVESKNDSVYIDPLLGLPIAYCLNGLCEMWTPDRAMHFKIYFKDNIMVADSLEFGGKISPISSIGLRINDLSIVNFLYYPELLSELQAEVDLKKKNNTSGNHFANNKYIHTYVYIDFEKEKNLKLYKPFSKIIEKTMAKGRDVIVTINLTNYHLESMEVNSVISNADQKIILGHLGQLITEAGIELNDMNAEGSMVIHFFMGGC